MNEGIYKTIAQMRGRKGMCFFYKLATRLGNKFVSTKRLITKESLSFELQRTQVQYMNTLVTIPVDRGGCVALFTVATLF